MGKAKMFKIRSIDTFSNVFQNEHYTNPVLKNSEGQEVNLKGLWRNEFFKNNNPLVLELACGKCEYSLALAGKYRDKNFIGIDAKGARIFTGAKAALEAGVTNLAFIRMRIENITNFFESAEIDEIWITFPDPFPKKRDAKRRLCAPAFLDRYRHICKKGAIIHFKTDDLALFRFANESMLNNGLTPIYYKEDIYAAPLNFEELAIKTHYEKLHLAEGKAINYLAFQF
jgi:tRNA (guanine-N7-)-methyltransferase